MTDAITPSIGAHAVSLYSHLCEHANASTNSVCESLGRGLGISASKTLTLSSTGTVQMNAFQTTGNVHIYSIHAEVTDATDITTCINVHFDFYDSNAAYAITKVTGATLTGLPVGTLAIKNEAVANELTIVDATNGAVTEATDPKKAFSSFCVTSKTGANNYIRFVYTNDATINAQITIYVEYHGLDGGTLVAV